MRAWIASLMFQDRRDCLAISAGSHESHLLELPRAGGPRTVRALNDVLNSHHPLILGLAETKKRKEDWDYLRVTLGYSNCFAVGREGLSGGLAVLLKDNVDLSIKSFSKYHIDSIIEGPQAFRLTIIYGDSNANLRYKSWEILRQLNNGNEEPWLVIGDFNEVMYSWEAKGLRARNQLGMRQFREVLDFNQLKDLGFQGATFTYSNRIRNDMESKSRIDRAVATLPWREQFPNATVHHIFANSSDHLPLHVEFNRRIRKQRVKSFRFEPMWLRNPEFNETVESSWLAASQAGSLGTILKDCGSQLSFWNSSRFGNVQRKIKNLKSKIQRLRTGQRTDIAVTEKANASQELDEWLEREELLWRQRARYDWIKEGDRNTKFFHAKASQSKSRNLISSLTNENGVSITDTGEMEGLAVEYFTNLFSSQSAYSGHHFEEALNLVPRRVTEEMNAKLVEPYSEGEIKRALFQMCPTKAPGIDGFSALFFQKYWNVVKVRVLQTCIAILNGDTIDSKLNETLLVLVPKVKTPQKMEDYIPISLCNVVMKIVTKTLANRLKDFLPALISENQSGFIKGRSITYNFLIAHEVLHSLKTKNNRKNGFMALKLDMSKAYGRIE